MNTLRYDVGRYGITVRPLQRVKGINLEDVRIGYSGFGHDSGVGRVQTWRVLPSSLRWRRRRRDESTNKPKQRNRQRPSQGDSAPHMAAFLFHVINPPLENCDPDFLYDHKWKICS